MYSCYQENIMFCFCLCLTTGTNFGVRLFHSENCDVLTVFGQEIATWPQGQKKNCIPLCSNQKAERPPKEKEWNIFLGVLSAFWSVLSLTHLFGLSALSFGIGAESSKYYGIDTPKFCRGKVFYVMIQPVWLAVLMSICIKTISTGMSSFGGWYQKVE